MRLKYLMKEFVYKFLVDYLAKNRIYKVKNIKFVDLLLNNFISKGFRVRRRVGIYRNIIIKGKFYNSVVLLVIVLFLLI